MSGDTEAKIANIEKVSEIVGRAHYFADRQEITMQVHSDICWLAEEVKRLRAALEEITYGLWGDMTLAGIAASMHSIAALALAGEIADCEDKA